MLTKCCRMVSRVGYRDTYCLRPPRYASWTLEWNIEHSERIYTGVLYGCSENARRLVFVVNETSEDSGESEVEYPLTPPLSEPSGSRSHSPEQARLSADLNVITMMHLRRRRNVAVRKQPKSAFRPVYLLMGVSDSSQVKVYLPHPGTWRFT